MYEEGDKIVSDSGATVRPVEYDDPSLYRMSGDGTVPYFSLSWAHTWLGDGPVNVSRVPNTPVFPASDVKACVHCDLGEWNRANDGRGANTFFQASRLDSRGKL